MRGKTLKARLALGITFALALSSCGILDVAPDQAMPDAWESAGFTKGQESAWEESGGFTLQEAQAWRTMGFPLSEASLWHKDGFDPNSAYVWKGSGFSAKEALSWIRVVPSPGLAQSWKSAGYLPENMQDFAGWTGFLPETAKEWMSTGATPAEVARFTKEGITPTVYRRSVKGNCKQFWHFVPFVTANPYEVKGACSFSEKGILRVVQFLGKHKALVMIPNSEYYLLVFVEKGTIPTNLGYLEGGLLVGKGAYKYLTAMDTEQVVPKALYLNFQRSEP